MNSITGSAVHKEFNDISFKYRHKTPLGVFSIIEQKGALTGLYLNKEHAEPDFACRKTPLIAETIKQLDEYLAGDRKEFELPLAPAGTEFQQKVWQALRTIGYGSTLSYQALAEKIGNPKACRAVGGANNKNPIIIIIPCHRVIGKDNSLTGFGAGLDVKAKLLALEKARK
ncbi:MAG: methylated-DNA--[protein]-cysteine S-methyltransferase [Acidaminococcales bacterium]|jgi:methylated-DNA-[protein]-cysteine S-methyltransferase|nr:methylated-DNA--[protein]-cysteine S-methyltransferase [Acidaminococcales bacterium]